MSTRLSGEGSRATFVCAAIACLTSSVASAQPRLEFVDGRLTVHVVDAVLHDVIGRLVELNIIEVVGQDRLVGTVSAEVVDKPVVEALDVLLAGYNFVI